MKLVYRLTSEHTYIYYFGLALPGLGVVPAWFPPGLQFYRGNIWSLEGVGYTSPHDPAGCVCGGRGGRGGAGPGEG